MDTAWELFVHELRNMLNCENQLVRILAEAETESSNESLRRAFEEHRHQTENHAARITQVFRDIGEVPEQGECKGVEGLKQEKQEIMKHDPSKELVDFINCGAGIKAERYEISSYENLILLARELGALNSARLLKENLNEEQEALEKLQNLTGMLKPKNLGVSTDRPEGGIPRRAA